MLGNGPVHAWRLASLTLLLLVPAATAGQDAAPSQLLGQRVRVVTEPAHRTVVGEVLAVPGDSVQIVQSSGDVAALALDDIVQWELSAGHVNRVGKGLAWGGGIGLLAGAVGGLALVNAACGSCDPNNAAGIAGGGGVGLLLGGIVGAVVGGITSGERWEPIEVDIGIVPRFLQERRPSSSTGPGVSFRVGFRLPR